MTCYLYKKVLKVLNVIFSLFILNKMYFNFVIIKKIEI